MKKKKTLKQALQEKEEKAKESALKREQEKKLLKEVRMSDNCHRDEGLINYMYSMFI